MTKTKVGFVYWSCLVIILLFVTSLYAEEADLKQKAIDAFENENYPEAISFLQEAASKDPNDPEVWYYLGYYTHYLCYDSRPLSGYNEEWSDKVLEYLYKAVELDPDYGDAYYFIGVEHGARLLNALPKGDLEKARKELHMGRNEGGYPDWLIEYARNMLSSCDSNAILFTGGDWDTWPTWYLQLCENYRTDVTVMPVAALERPWFARILKNGLGGIFASIPISWSEEQILNMHPYKWKIRKVKIPIRRSDMERYNLAPKDSIIGFELEPDLRSKSRTYLSTKRALMVDIIETNQWKRPIFFSSLIPRKYKVGLDNYFQGCGLVIKLLPVNVKEHNLSINPAEIERVLLNPESYQQFGDVKIHNMPRVSRILNNYRWTLYSLASYYGENGDCEKAKEILDKMKTYMPEEAFPVPLSLKKGIKELPGYLKIKELGIPEILLKTLSEKGIDAAVEQYNELKDKHAEYIEVCERIFNEEGYELLKKNREKEAIEVFKLNVALFPDSFNVYDSLGEAYMVAGEKELAIKNYKKSLELNPNNANAAEMLKKTKERK